MRIRTIAAAASLAVGTATVYAGDGGTAPAPQPQASIPFVNIGSSIRSWQADRDEGLWVQDARREWYYAKLFAPCQGLDFAVRVGFRTGASDKLDRFSSVVVPGFAQCPIESFTKSDAPPEGRRHADHEVEKP